MMSAYATALLESPHGEVVDECLRQRDRAIAAESRLEAVQAVLNKWELYPTFADARTDLNRALASTASGEQDDDE